MEALLNLCHSPQGGQVNSTILPTTDSDIEDLLDFCHGPEGETEPSIPPPQAREGQGETEPSIPPPQESATQPQEDQRETEPSIPPPPQESAAQPQEDERETEPSIPPLQESAAQPQEDEREREPSIPPQAQEDEREREPSIPPQAREDQGEPEPSIPPPEAPIDFDLADLIQLTIGELSKDQSDVDMNSLSFPDKPVDPVMHNRNQTVISQMRKQTQINGKLILPDKSVRCCHPQNTIPVVANGLDTCLSPHQIKFLDDGESNELVFKRCMTPRMVYNLCKESNKSSRCICCLHVEKIHFNKTKYACTQSKKREENRNLSGWGRQRGIKKDLINPPLNPYEKNMDVYNTRYMRYTFPDHKPCCPCCQFAAVFILNQNNTKKRSVMRKKKERK